MNELKKGHRSRLKNKYFEKGISSLFDYEILELLLSYSIIRKDCKPLAKQLLEKYKNLSGVLNSDSEEILKIKGLGKETSLFLRFIKDIHKIYIKETKLEKQIYINSSKDLVDYLKLDLQNKQEEIFKVVFLDTQNKFIKEEELFRGTIDKSHIYPREIVKKILDCNAKSVIFVHNHPSGIAKPSTGDIDITKKMKSILENLDINVLDHIIIGKNDYFSFSENKIL